MGAAQSLPRHNLPPESPIWLQGNSEVCIRAILKSLAAVGMGICAHSTHGCNIMHA